jgi:DNA-directed RNA polymerase specialized sigma24 family protein
MRVQATMNQTDVSLGQLEAPAPHIVIIEVAPVRFHDARVGVPLDPLQDMNDLVRKHMSQQNRRPVGSYRVKHAIVEQHNAAARVVELRYFGGMTEEETAAVLKSSPRTVRRDWQFARAWLQHELTRA